MVENRFILNLSPRFYNRLQAYLTKAVIPPAFLIALLFSSFCLPYERFLKYLIMQLEKFMGKLRLHIIILNTKK